MKNENVDFIKDPLHEGNPDRPKYDDREIPLVGLWAKIYAFFKYSYWKSVYKGYRQKYNIPKSFRLNGDNILLCGDGELNIKGMGLFCKGVHIELPKGSKVELGRGVWISKNVVMYSRGYNTTTTNGRFHLDPKEKGSIIIGDRVFIKPFVHIDSDVKIGNDVIIEPCSFVDRDIPNNSIFKNGEVNTKYVMPYKWMPNFVDATDASARTLNVYNEINSAEEPTQLNMVL